MTNQINGFRKFADRVLNDYELIIGSETYIITEISFHQNSSDHLDPWVYKKSGQLQSKNWFIYLREGDPEQPMIEMTFGNADEEKYAGILLRGIHNATNEPTYGPVNVAKKILNILNIAPHEAKKRLSGQKLNEANSTFFIRENKLPRLARMTLEAPRPNLDWNNSNDSLINKARFRLATYRFFTFSNFVYDYEDRNNNSALLWLNLFLSGAAGGLTENRSKELIEEFELGQNQDLELVSKSLLSSKSVGHWECKLLGAWCNYKIVHNISF